MDDFERLLDLFKEMRKITESFIPSDIVLNFKSISKYNYTLYSGHTCFSQEIKGCDRKI